VAKPESLGIANKNKDKRRVGFNFPAVKAVSRVLGGEGKGLKGRGAKMDNAD